MQAVKAAKTVQAVIDREDDEILRDDQRVDEAGTESFPASDPPSWTFGVDRPPPELKEANKKPDQEATEQAAEPFGTAPPGRR